MKMNTSVGSMFEIPLEINITFWPIFLLIVMQVTQLFGSSVAGISTFGAFVLAVVNVALVYFTLVLHEIGHSLAARHYNIDVSRIILFMLGGVAAMEEEPKTPLSEFVVAIAGPLVSVVIGGLCFLTLFSLTGSEALTSADGSLHFPNAALATLTIVGFTNIFIACFNMIPAYPMDGGRILHSALWKMLGWRRGTKISVLVASVAAISFFGATIYMAFGNFIPFLGDGLGDGIMVAIIGAVLLAHSIFLWKGINSGKVQHPAKGLG